MDEIDYDAEFRKLTSSMADPEISISLSDIAEFIELLSEATLHMGRFISISLACEGDETLEIPENLITLIPHLSSGLMEATDLLHDIVCEDDEELDET